MKGKNLTKIASGSLLAVVGGMIATSNAEASSIQDVNVLGSGSNVRMQIIQSLSEDAVVYGKDKEEKEDEEAEEAKKDDSKAGEGKCGEGKCGEAMKKEMIQKQGEGKRGE